MKKSLFIVLAVAVVAAFIMPSALAADREFSNAEKNIGNVVAAGPRAVGRVMCAIGGLFQLKPAKTVTLFRDIRREAFDGVESIARIPASEPIAKEEGEMGVVNTGIADAKMDPVVDGLICGFIVGPAIFNNATASSHHILTEQAWWGGVAAGTGAVLLDVGGAALEASEK